jgi:DNA-binding PadR family transcriptional regulator
MNTCDKRLALDVTRYHFTFTQAQWRSTTILIRNPHYVLRRCFAQGPLKYNELKTAILDLLTTEGWCDSNQIIERARSESGLSASSRAVRMALLRYHRHGLLHREWRRGEYVYRLSDRGARRLVWLRGLTPDQLTGSVDALMRSRLDGSNPSQ